MHLFFQIVFFGMTLCFQMNAGASVAGLACVFEHSGVNKSARKHLNVVKPVAAKVCGEGLGILGNVYQRSMTDPNLIHVIMFDLGVLRLGTLTGWKAAAGYAKQNPFSATLRGSVGLLFTAAFCHFHWKLRALIRQDKANFKKTEEELASMVDQSKNAVDSVRAGAAAAAISVGVGLDRIRSGTSEQTGEIAGVLSDKKNQLKLGKKSLKQMQEEGYRNLKNKLENLDRIIDNNTDASKELVIETITKISDELKDKASTFSEKQKINLINMIDASSQRIMQKFDQTENKLNSISKECAQLKEIIEDYRKNKEGKNLQLTQATETLSKKAIDLEAQTANTVVLAENIQNQIGAKVLEKKASSKEENEKIEGIHAIISNSSKELQNLTNDQQRQIQEARNLSVKLHKELTRLRALRDAPGVVLEEATENKEEQDQNDG